MSRFIYIKNVEENLAKDVVCPYALYIDTESRPDFICISEGAGHGSMGGSLTPAQFISKKWIKCVDRFQADWLVDLIRSVGPETITSTEIIDYWRKNDV